MSYFKETHGIKKIMKNDVVAPTSVPTAINMLSAMGGNYADEILWGISLVCTNRLKGYFIFQGNCRLTIFNSNSTAVNVYPYFSSNQTTTALKNMQSSNAAIRDNVSTLLEGYPNVATSFSDSIDFTNSIVNNRGASSNKASGTPEIWLLPIGENK
jgi:hypothetical protein